MSSERTSLSLQSLVDGFLRVPEEQRKNCRVYVRSSTGKANMPISTVALNADRTEVVIKFLPPNCNGRMADVDWSQTNVAIAETLGISRTSVARIRPPDKPSDRQKQRDDKKAKSGKTS